MLPRALRLTESAEYQRLFKDAASGYGRLVTVRLLAADRPQAGVIVSKRTAPRAVDRNRIKRRLRPLLGTFLAASPGYQVAVIAKAPARDASLAELAEDLRTALETAKRKADASDRQ